MQNCIVVLLLLSPGLELALFPLFIFSHINRRTQFENPVLEAKRRLEQQRQMQSQGLSALPLPTIYRGTNGVLQYVQYLNQNMLTYLQSCTNMKMRGLQKGHALHRASVFRPSKPPECADKLIVYSPCCTDCLY